MIKNNTKLHFFITLLFFGVLFSFLGGCATNAGNSSEKGVKRMSLSRKYWKYFGRNNPISSNIFCADPTGIEYNGRLYIYGTNDHQQYEAVGNNGKNTYEKINSLVCFSTEDMVNWTYEGLINTKKIAPWIVASWAPSICSRVEEDGLTHFYLYFSNSGCGVGVLTATSPTGPWTSPLKQSLIYPGLKTKYGTLTNCPAPFDPGVVIDDNGVGWLAFGGGKAENGTEEYPGVARIVKLGKDMISVDSDFIELKAPYFFEASEMNYWNGIYVYTFNSSWVERKKWAYDVPSSTACSMNYMTTKTPLDSDSWKYEGNYFKNPGEQGFDYSNNHTHLMEYKGQNYLLYHTLSLQENSPTKGGFRSMCVDKIDVNASDSGVKIGMCKATRDGVPAIANLNPYETVKGSTMVTSAEIWWESQEIGKDVPAMATNDGSWILVKNVDFDANGSGAAKIVAEAKGSGRIEFRLDSSASKAVASVELSENYEAKTSEIAEKLSGVHDVYICFSDKGSCLKNWRAE